MRIYEFVSFRWDQTWRPTQAPQGTGMQIQVSAFHFLGNTLLNAAQLQSALSRSLNRPLDYAQLQAAEADVMDL